MNLNQLRYADAVLQEGSFSKASDRCNVSQPTLSNGIAALEEEFGGNLFNRTTRKTEISEFGRQILPLIEAVLLAEHELISGVHSYHNPAHKMIRVGFSPLINIGWIKNCVEALLTDGGDIEPFYKECLLDDLQQRLQEQSIDLIIKPKATKSENDVKLKHTLLHSEAMFYLPRADPSISTTNNAPVTVEEISSQRFILTNGGCGLSDFIANLFSSAGFKLRVYAGEAVSYQVLSEWSELGIGSAILPESKVKGDSNARAKAIVHSNGEPVVIEYFAYWLENNKYPKHVDALHTFFEQSASKYMRGLNS